MQVTVKTLDSETRVFSVSEEATVEEFKKQIAPDVGIPVERQRLIFKGKVLQDSAKLQSYGVDGCVVHLVERRPPTTGTRTVPDGASSERSGNHTSGQSGEGGGFNLPTDVMNLSQQIVQGLVSQLGLNSAQANVSTSQSGDGSTLNVHINLLASANAANDAGVRISRARHFLRAARNSLNRSEGDSSVLPESGVAMDTSSPTSESQSTNQQTNSGSQASTNQNTTPGTLADVLGELQEMTSTLDPHLQRYRTLLNSNSTEDLLPSDDSLPDRFAEALHNLSHAYHALSDLTFNFRSPEPRRLNVLPTLSNHVGASPLLSSLFSGGQTPTPQPGQQAPQGNTDARIHVVPGGSAIAFTSIISGSLPPSGIYNQQPSTTTMGGANRPGGQPMFSFNLGQGSQGNNNQRTTSNGNSTTSTSSTTSGSGSENVRIVMDDFVALFSNAGQPVTSHSETSRTSTTTPSQEHSQGDTDTQTQNSGTAGASRTIPRINIGNLPMSSNHQDPLVPCESFHFGPRSRQPQGTQTGESQSQANQNDGLAQTFSNVVASVIQDNIAGQPSSGSRAGQTAGNPGTTNTNTQSSTGTTAQVNSSSTTEINVTEALNPFIQLLSGFHGQQSTNETNESTNRPSQQERSSPFPGMDMNLMHLLMNVIGGARGDGDSPQQSIHDFLQNLDEATGESHDESANIFEGPLINQFIDRVSTTMSMHDLIFLLMGMREPFGRLHGVLHVYLHTDLLGDDPATDENLQRVASSIASELADGLSDSMTSVPAAENVDIKASIISFLEHAINRTFVMTRDLDNNTFTAEFPIHLRQSIHDLCILITMCLRDGVHGAENMLTTRLPVSALTRDVNPLMRQTFQSTATQFLHNAYAQRRQREDTLKQFIRTQETQPVEVPAPVVADHSTAEACEVSSQKSDDSDGFVTPPLSMSANDAQDYTPLEDQAEDAMDLDDEEEEDDDWKTVVPEHWVPIIARDVIRQRRLPQQAPFSDAYLSGLPPKRRKTADQRALSSTSENIPSILRQAVLAAGVTPRTSMEAVAADARHSSDLHESYRDEVKKAVKTRTSKDTDYAPEKFPSTKDYLEKS